MIDDKAIMAAASKYNSDKGFHEEMERISFIDGVTWFKQAFGMRQMKHLFMRRIS